MRQEVDSRDEMNRLKCSTPPSTLLFVLFIYFILFYFIHLFSDCNIRRKIVEYNGKKHNKSNHWVQTGYGKHLRLTRRNRSMCESSTKLNKTQHTAAYRISTTRLHM